MATLTYKTGGEYQTVENAEYNFYINLIKWIVEVPFEC